MNMLVANLEDDIDEELLKEEFSNFGPVVSVDLKPPKPGFVTRVAFVKFSNRYDGECAMEDLNGKSLRLFSRRRMRIREAPERSHNRSTLLTSPLKSPASDTPSLFGMFRSLFGYASSSTTTYTHSEEKGNYTLFLRNLDLHVSKMMLMNIFSAYGSVRNCIIYTDEKTGVSRGQALVTFERELHAALALSALNGKTLPGCTKTVRIDPFLSKEDRDKKQSALPVAASAPPNVLDPARTLFVGNLEQCITEALLISRFGRFGMVCNVTMKDDNKNQKKAARFAFVTFERAEKALVLNGTILLLGCTQSLTVRKYVKKGEIQRHIGEEKERTKERKKCFFADLQVPSVPADILDLYLSLFFAAVASSRRDLILTPVPDFTGNDLASLKDELGRTVKVNRQIKEANREMQQQHIGTSSDFSDIYITSVYEALSKFSKHVPCARLFMQSPTFFKAMKDELPFLGKCAEWLFKTCKSEWHRIPPKQILRFGNTPFQYICISDCPLKERSFEQHKRANGNESIFLLHGSTIENWHSILRNGLKVLSGTNLMTTGSAYGTGIYLSNSSNLSKSYSLGTHRSLTQQSIRHLRQVCSSDCCSNKPALTTNCEWAISVVEVVNSPRVLSHPHSYIYVLKDSSYCCIRMLLLYDSQANSPSETISPGNAQELRQVLKQFSTFNSAG